MRRKLRNHELGRLDPAAYKLADKHPVILVLDDIRSLHNVGSIFRTADAFRIDKIYLCGITGIPPHRDIRKTALGATESVEWEYREDILSLIEELKEKNIVTVSIEQAEGSIELADYYPSQEYKTALIFGNEVKGVHQEVVNRSDVCVEIPQYGTKHSFNVSVSVGIVLWEIVQKIKH
jgi:tRNA G18 (ribose-2'-O)-methylase SpoU